MSADDGRLESALALRGYVICATQRSGSNLLCELLASTGVLGRPLDYFNGAGRRSKGWAGYPDDAQQQLDMVLQHSPSSNSVYGFKLFAHDLERLGPQPWTDRTPNLQWIHLQRLDLLGQAISLLIAEQTGQWRSTSARAGLPTYDAAGIEERMLKIARENAQWRLYFARHGIDPLELTYEALADSPQAAVDAVASLVRISGSAAMVQDQVELEVQRDALSEDWRRQFLAGAGDRARLDPVDLASGATQASRFWIPPLARARPRLTVSILTRNGEQRLPRLLSEAASYADQILVGVDASSTDNTFEVASSGADTVYRFQLPMPGQMAPARMLALDFATGDWILSLDDDEGMDGRFESVLPELMAADGITNHNFRRKWIVSDDPVEYAHQAPWYPNWARRMFRNDKSLVWKPPVVHSQYFVQGPAHFEERTCILHLEPLLCSPEDRRRKVEAYRLAGAAESSENFYDPTSAAHRRPAYLRATKPAPAPRANPSIHPDVRRLERVDRPPWRSAVISAEMPPVARPGEVLIVEVIVRNTGVLAWTPTHDAAPWPELRLTYHVLQADGSVCEWDNERTILPRYVAPSAMIMFTFAFTCPMVPGDYLIEWDMLSERECWFAECGSTVLRKPLRIAAA